MKRLFFLLFSLIFFCCKQQEPERPENLIPQDKMVQILADIHTVEARIENRVSYPDTSLMVFNKEQSKVLEQHDVTLEQFKETYQFYLDNVKQMDKLYEVIIDTLSAREVKARTSYQPNQLKVEGTELRPVE